MSAAVTSPPPTAGGNNALSDKVQRALQVRTDTPAMKAALDALAHLPANIATTTGGAKASGEETVIVDSRSVRVAIEQDALQQALLLQGELQKLVDTVVTLRQGVSDTAAIADRLCREIQTDVTVTLQPTPSVLPPVLMDSTTEGQQQSEGSTEHNTPTTQLEESQLARTLHDAFMAREQAEKRLTVVQAFLDKFDLSEEDARLLDHYNFEDAVEAVAMGAESPVNGMAFLKALARVVQIRTALSESFGDTASASGAGSGDGSGDGLGASSALRMMESLAQKQEQAYERLYHWLQNFLQLSANNNATQASGGEDSGEDRLDEIVSHPFCQLALKTLQHVPAFYTHTLELIATARRTQATKQFLLALTSGYAGMPPLEMKAHDPVVYVGDMLAFVFRSFSVEADFARSMQSLQLSPIGGGDEEENSSTAAETTTMDSSEHEMGIPPASSMETPALISTQETLALTMSGVARPLKSRILQVIATLARSVRDGEGGDNDELESHDSMMDELEEEGTRARHKVTQLYEICGLLLFYSSAMETTQLKLDPRRRASLSGSFREDSTATPAPATHEHSPLMKSVLECLGEATSAYEATFRVYSAMLEQLTVASGDSEAALANQIIVAIAQSRAKSPGFSQDVPCPKEYSMILSLDWALEVILEATLNSCKSLDDAHCLQEAVLKSQTGAIGDAAQELTRRIQEKESELIQELVSRETVNVMDLCGLGSTATAWKNFQKASAEGGALTESLAAYPGLGPEEVQDAIKEFYTSLYSPPLPSLETGVKDPTVRKAARRQIAGRVCTFYKELYEAIMAAHSSESGGYEDVKFLGHTPEQVVTLFSA
ncbi:Golgi complex subunit 6 [Seminavis robusta]|uniref:Golgi complex subunit 6 n=1 Tax=Seminavis robusta TaxID=568900 RepID=A0A9N8DDJ8_9STRA|nr:Golgi complex subunit 6 [Seminavis robusta]|eukprot:Sro70_g038740.1 Golgi complex subunit 6 (835) ;mRNA; r:7041-9545